MKSTVLAAAAVLVVLGSHVQAAAPVGPPKIDTFGDWNVRCFPVKTPTPCDAYYAIVRKGTSQRIASISIAFTPKANHYGIQINVPYGVAIQSGVTLTAGAYASPKLAYHRCDRNGCFVEGAVAEDLLNGLRSGGDAKGEIDVFAAQSLKKIALPLSLRGFGDALDDMVKEARDKAETE